MAIGIVPKSLIGDLSKCKGITLIPSGIFRRKGWSDTAYSPYCTPSWIGGFYKWAQEHGNSFYNHNRFVYLERELVHATRLEF